jgi:hypothetical protein
MPTPQWAQHLGESAQGALAYVCARKTQNAPSQNYKKYTTSTHKHSQAQANKWGKI